MHLNEQLNKIKSMMGIKPLNEYIDPKTVLNDQNSLESIYSGKRNVGTIVKHGGVRNKSWEETLKDIEKHGLNLMKVESNPYGLYIVYKKYAHFQAKELHDIAEKNEGYLSVNAPIEDSVRIGELLEYNPESIKQYVIKNYPAEEVQKYYTNKNNFDI